VAVEDFGFVLVLSLFQILVVNSRYAGQVPGSGFLPL
jgi:hypothetical protein